MSDFCEMAENVRRREGDPPGGVVPLGDGFNILPGGLRSALSASETDILRQPHYAYGIEPIEYMQSRFTREEFRGWLTGNVLKYVSRFTRKDGIRDLEKAADYLRRLIAFERNQEAKP